ncbi:uncharacterized protein LOC131804703 [Musca domestica]|uniref:Uncharacterized protein LOC131804703 n=1 Tax=Musca domestica TaxID=7370 RepID=A0ABM3VD86_MUSDO|nr:uncharacterized protein LOC131804703 [Musca domestica]
MIIIVVLAIIYGMLFHIGTSESVNVNLSFINVIVNDRSIRVLLGQSFVMPKKPRLWMKYICFLLCYTSLIISTTYQAYLQSNLIHPALEKRVGSYDDMIKAGLKIAITSQELEFLDKPTYIKYKELFVSIEPYDRFLKLREKDFIYYSSHLCLSKQALLAVPLRPNLPYKSLFDKHLLHLRETGLLQYWISVNFYTMVRLKITAFRDLSTPEESVDAIELDDLKWIWLFYCSNVLLAISVLICELIYFHKVTKHH